MLIMETKNKLNYEVISEGAFVPMFDQEILFMVSDKQYIATCTYDNVDGSSYDFSVEDGDDLGLVLDEDSDVYQLGVSLLEDMAFNDATVNW
jgi:hypothetical protein